MRKIRILTILRYMKEKRTVLLLLIGVMVVQLSANCRFQEIETRLRRGEIVELPQNITLDDLVYSAWNGCHFTLQMLLSNNSINLNRRNQDSFSPLLIASRNGHTEAVKTLIEAGADINYADIDGLTPLRYAVLFNHYDTAVYLLSQGADSNISDRYKWTPLLSAVINDNTAMTRLLLDYKADPNRKITKGNYPLIEAIKNNNIEIVKLLLENGANIKVRDVLTGKSPLFLALEMGNVLIFKDLMDYGADVTETNKDFGQTLLMRAATLSNQDIVSMLIDGNIDEVDSNGWTALFYAVERNDEIIIRILIEAGADINHEDKKGETAFSLWDWKLTANIRDFLKITLEEKTIGDNNNDK